MNLIDDLKEYWFYISMSGIIFVMFLLFIVLIFT